MNEHVVALGRASGTNASGTTFPQPSRPVRAPPSSHASSSTSIEPRHIRPSPRARGSRARPLARWDRSCSSSSTASTSAPSAIVPRDESRKCSRKCSGVKCDSAPSRTDTFVTPVAPSDSASITIRVIRSRIKCLLVHPASSSTSSTARSTPSCAGPLSSVPEPNTSPSIPKTTIRAGSRPIARGELDRLADPERMGRGAELPARAAPRRSRRTGAPCPVPPRRRPRRRRWPHRLPPRRRSAASARARRRRLRLRPEPAPARAARPRGPRRRRRGRSFRPRSPRFGSLAHDLQVEKVRCAGDARVELRIACSQT